MTITNLEKTKKIDNHKKLNKYKMRKRNNDLIIVLDNFKDSGKEDRVKFKTDFNKDLEGFGNAFKNIK
jgi:hypothetical protein